MSAAEPFLDYEQADSLQFTITREYYQAFRRWAKAIDNRVFQAQLAGQFLPVGQSGSPETLDLIIEICRDNAKANGRAYYGVTGSGYRFIFVPSSLGLSIEVENIWTGERIDLTKDANW